MIVQRMFNYPSYGWQNPFADLGRMSRHLDFLARAMSGRPAMNLYPSRVFPAVNISENADKYFVRAELPGIKADEIDLQVTGKNLTISGERTIETGGDSAKYHRRERDAGRFSRVIGLPGDIDADSVSAEMVNGVLTVEISKSEASKPKKISVH